MHSITILVVTSSHRELVQPLCRLSSPPHLAPALWRGYKSMRSSLQPHPATSYTACISPPPLAMRMSSNPSTCTVIHPVFTHPFSLVTSCPLTIPPHSPLNPPSSPLILPHPLSFPLSDGWLSLRSPRATPPPCPLQPPLCFRPTSRQERRALIRCWMCAALVTGLCT